MNYTVTFLLGMLFPGRTKLQAWHASAEHSKPQTWKLSSCVIMPHLAPAGDAPADRNSAHWKWLDADEGKLRTGHTRSHLVTRGSQQWGYWHRPWENLLSIWPMELHNNFQSKCIPSSNSWHQHTWKSPISMWHTSTDPQGLNGWMKPIGLGRREQKSQACKLIHWQFISSHQQSLHQTILSQVSEVQMGKSFLPHKQKQ